MAYSLNYSSSHSLMINVYLVLLRFFSFYKRYNMQTRSSLRVNENEVKSNIQTKTRHWRDWRLLNTHHLFFVSNKGKSVKLNISCFRRTRIYFWPSCHKWRKNRKNSHKTKCQPGGRLFRYLWMGENNPFRRRWYIHAFIIVNYNEPLKPKARSQNISTVVAF